MNFNQLSQQMMRNYARAIIHLREQKRLKRFGLVFGAGISTDFGFPSWNELVNRIAKDKRVNGHKMIAKAGNHSSVSQILYQNYRAKALAELPEGFDQYDRLHSYLQAGWHRIIHDALYADVPNNINELQNRDPYLKEFINIIKESPLTVNYNFDDTLQTLLSESRTEDERKKKRGFRTVWSADIQLHAQNGVIYHPNGYLPRDFRERPSDDLIFLENTFGDQLIESAAGHYAALAYHLSQNTILFVGLSLEDSTLKHLLRRNAKLHPGHVHYYIHFLQDPDALDDEHRRAIRDANFEVYNLITLFLDREGIRTLGRLLTVSEDDIGMFAEDVGVPTSYKFFLTGSVAVGKSTAVRHFRSLLTHDEWLEKKIPEMDRDPNQVQDANKIREIDEWIAQQWRLKNFTLNHSTRQGIHLIDRCPLDAIAFTPENQWKEKASFTRERITPKEPQTQLCKGQILLLVGDPEVMAVRALKLQKQVTPEELYKRQEFLRVVYDRAVCGIVELDTREKSIARVAKEVCRAIHLADYQECDLQRRLEEIERGSVCAPSNSN